MTVRFAEQSYLCTRAVRSGETATLYLEDGGTVALIGVSDWGAITIEGGTWLDTNIRTLDEEKESKILYSKDELSRFLSNNPITWIDGNTYSVTEEKQNLLTSNIALYQLSVQAGKPRELKWNTTGDVCTVWTIENLSALALAIGDYVQPYVAYQQTVEVQIKECTTMEELEAIVIDYSTVSTVEPEVLTGEQGS